MEKGAYTLQEWLHKYRITKPTYYNLPPEARPQITKLGRLNRITREHDEEWARKVNSGEISLQTRRPLKTEAA